MTTYFSDFYPLDSADGAKGSAAFLGAISTAIVYLYKRSATALTGSDKPNGDVIYTFATGNTNISAVSNGWSITIPSGTDPLYVVAATATAIDATDTIASTEWSSPVVLAQNGLAGTSAATIFLFQRGTTSTLPAVPASTLTYTFATGLLSGTLGSWTQSAPDSSLGKYLFVTTATAISTGTTDTILTSEWATVRILAENGTDGYTAYLTNESHTLPAASDGSVSSYTGATGSFIIYKTGTGDISSNFTLSTVSGANPQTLTVGYAGNVYTVSGGLDAGESLATVTIRATGSGIYNGITIDKVFSLTKSVSGTNGANAKLLNIISDRQVVNYTGAGALNPAAQITTFTAYKQNTTATVSWTISDTLGNVLTPSTYLSAVTGDSTTMTAANFTSAISVNGANGVKVTATLTDGTTLTDVITIVKVIDGVNGTNGTNSAIVYLYQRAATSPAAPTGTFTYTFSTSALSGGVPGSWTQAIPAANGSPLWVIAATASSSGATDTIAATEFTTPVTLVQDGTNGTNGLNSASVFLYKRGTSTPAIPTTTLTYTFSTGILSGTLDSWTQTVPSGTDPVYVITATAVSTGTTDTILTSEWSAATILAQNGTNGTNGTNSAIVYLYQRAAASPAAPAGTFTYTFSTGAVSGGTPGSWTQTIPATNGNPLWVIAATASSSGATDSIAATEFSSPVTLVQDGTNGTNGLNSASVFLYKRGTSTPAVPATTLTYTFATGILSGTLSSWTQAVPSGTDPVYVITATAVSTGTTDTILTSEWSTPVILVQNGIDGTNGTSPVSGYITRDTGLVFTFADGTPTGYSGLNGFLKLFNGITDVTSSATGLTATASGCTGTINTSDNTPVNGQIKGYYQVTAMSADTATLVLSGTYGGVTVTKTYYLSKVKAGYDIVSTLPTTNLFQGRTVFLTTDNKLYRYSGIPGSGGVWTSLVPAADISGTLADAQIAAVAASKVTGTLSDTQLAAISAAKITGQITSTQITDGSISTAKIAAGAITSNEIAANTIVAADIAASTITATQIAAATITGAKIAAGTIAAGNIVANTITASQIAANTITATQLAASTITANEIAAGTITGAKLSTGQLISVSAQIGTGVINTANIGDLQVNSAKIANLTVGTQKIEDLAISRSSSSYYNFNGYSYPTDQTWYELTSTISSYVFVGAGNGSYSYQQVGTSTKFGFPEYDYVSVGAGNGDYNFVTQSAGLVATILAGTSAQATTQVVNIEAVVAIERDGGNDDTIKARIIRTNDSLILPELYNNLRVRAGISTYGLSFRDPSPISGVVNTYKVQLFNINDNCHIYEAAMRATLFRK